MSSLPRTAQSNLTPSSVSSSNPQPREPCSSTHRKTNTIALRPTRRSVTAAALLSTVLLASENVLNPKPALCFDFGFIAPDQTPEEAYAGVRAHARALVRVKALIDSRSWPEAQTELRESSSKLKQDIYTIIQVKPGSLRPQLRRLYSDLFNSVTRMDYAARSEDVGLVEQHYQNVVAILEVILSKI